MPDKTTAKRYATAHSLPFLNELDALVVQHKTTKEMVLMVVDFATPKHERLHCLVEAREEPRDNPSALSMIDTRTGKIIGMDPNWDVVFCQQHHEFLSLKSSNDYEKLFEYVAKNSSKHEMPMSLMADMARYAFGIKGIHTSIQDLSYRQVWEMRQRYHEIEQDFCVWSTPETPDFDLLNKMTNWVFDLGADPNSISKQDLSSMEEDTRKLMPHVLAPKLQVTPAPRAIPIAP